ncbi:MAG: outer membrane beta-barrel protein [Arenicella sp.]
MKKTKLTLSAVALFISSQPVFAGQWSLGVNLGQSSSDAIVQRCDTVRNGYKQIYPTDEFTCNVDDSDTSLGLNLNYNFNKTWGLEFGYVDFGQYTNTVSTRDGFFTVSGTDETLPTSMDVSALYLAATSTWDMSEAWSVTGRLGVAKVDVDFLARNNTPAFASSGDDTSVMAGLSMNYKLQKQWMLVLRYDYFDFAPEFEPKSRLLNIDTNIDVLSLGVTKAF